MVESRWPRLGPGKLEMCTGKAKAENPQRLSDIAFDGMIGGNGCYVESDGEVVMHQLITADQCRHIVDWLHGRGLEFYLESNNGLFASERFREAAAPVMTLLRKGKGASSGCPDLGPMRSWIRLPTAPSSTATTSTR